MFEIDGGVGVDETECNGLGQAGVHRCVVVVTKPLETRENRGGVLPRPEGRVVVVEAVLALNLQNFIVQSGRFVVQRVARLVPTAPEVRDAPHVGVAAVVDGGGEPLLVGFRVVVHLFGGVFRGSASPLRLRS